MRTKGIITAGSKKEAEKMSLKAQFVKKNREPPSVCPRCGADNCMHSGDPYGRAKGEVDDEWRCSNCGLTSWNLRVHGSSILTMKVGKK